MSRAIAALLNEPEHLVRKAVKILEDKNGYPSHDVRHLADNIQRVRAKIAELNLDPDDTTAEELYHALLVKFQKDSKEFDACLGAENQTYDQRVETAINLVSKKLKLPEVWTLKSQAAKQLLKSEPPKKLMKFLGYRSVDSLIKRQNLAELQFMFAYFESNAWNKIYLKKLNALDSSHFELQPIKLVNLSLEKWNELEINQPIVFNASVGAFGLLPEHSLQKASLLSLVVLLIDELSCFGEVSLSELGPLAGWWHDTDGLIAKLAGGNVSMNITDVAINHLAASDLNDQELKAGRRSFWDGLVSRYQNLLTAEEDLGMSFERPVAQVKAPISPLAFEYAEDI
jgi:hypothetical protein